MSLARYDVLSAFARGGMADISIARSIESGHLSVVKRMRADADNRRTRRMFRDEIRITASMCHPNIVEVRDCNMTIGEDYLVMEYVHGRDLRKLLAHAAKSELVPIGVATSIIASAAAGLHHAHELRGFDGSPFDIVHRDISPTNILVGFDGSVKVIDFGIAKASFTREDPGLVKGKTSYMAPEQCLGKPLDRRTDIFSLGIVLYELLTASRLFRLAGDERSTMRAIACGHVPPPTQRRPEIDAAVEAVVMKALALQPNDRYQTADEFRAALVACRPLDVDAIANTMNERFDIAEPSVWGRDELTRLVDETSDIVIS